MIKYQILQGVRLPQATGLPVVAPTPEGKAMGAIPGWNILIDPDYVGHNSVLNRAKIDSMFMASNSGYEYGAISGETAFSLGGGPRFAPTVDMNPTAWSAFFVVQTPRDGATGGRELLRPIEIDTEGVGPRVTIRANGHLWLYGTSTTVDRLGGPEIPDNEAFLAMATFSTRDGTKLYCDGELVAANPDDKRPLDEKYSAGEYMLLSGTSADLPMLVGMCGVLDIDLGWPEHAGYRRAIERFLMDKYGIT